MKKLTKNELRKHFINLRNNMTKNEIKKKSSIIHEKIYSLMEFQKASTIMLYAAFNNEVETRLIFEKCHKAGQRTVFPKCLKHKKEMKLFEINDYDRDLKKSAFGILEPKHNSLESVNPLALDLIIVPGLAFDLECYRLGYGAGYYDRFLSSLKNRVFTAGVAFDIQIIEKLPRESHDIPLDCIVTEKRIIRNKIQEMIL